MKDFLLMTVIVFVLIIVMYSEYLILKDIKNIEDMKFADVLIRIIAASFTIISYICVFYVISIFFF